MNLKKLLYIISFITFYIILVEQNLISHRCRIKEKSRIKYSRGLGSRYATRNYYTAPPPPSRMNSYFFLGYPYSYPYSYYYPQMPYAFGYNGTTGA